MEQSIINEKEYYNVKDIKSNHPTLFYGYSKSPREIIEKKNIPNDEYLYATYNEKKQEWTIYDKDKKVPNKVSLYISKSWCDDNLLKPKRKIAKKNKLEKNENKKEDIKDEENEKEYEEAPELIVLDDNEKFRDNEGNIYEIETRGTRDHDGIYFLAEDIAKAFEIGNIRTYWYNNESFVYGDHYKSFIVQRVKKNDEKKNKKMDVMTYLTYEGVICVLFTTRSKKAKSFTTWATKTLFTVQMGTIEQKQQLASGLIGIPIDSLKQVLSTSAKSVPCIYQFSLGIVKDLKKSMKLSEDIPDNHVVIKYGFTDDLARRSSEHEKTYGKIKGVKFELMLFIYIDPKYLSQAEKDVKNYFETNEKNIKYESFKELIIVNPKNMPQITKQFKYIGKDYSGCVDELTKRIEDEKTKAHIEKMNYEIELMKSKHNNELLMKDNELLKKENNILSKDLEIAKMKLELAMIKNK
jgi:hypothetical protein